MIQPLSPPQQGVAAAMLSKVAFRQIKDGQAARLLGLSAAHGEPLASAVFRAFLDDLRRRKHRAEVGRRDSWSVRDQQELKKLSARFETGDHRTYRAFLVRAVSKFDNGLGGPPTMLGDLCGADLHLLTVVMSYTVPLSVRAPAVVFLPRAPQRVISTVRSVH